MHRPVTSRIDLRSLSRAPWRFLNEVAIRIVPAQSGRRFNRRAMGSKRGVDVVGSLAQAGQRLVSIYRRTGADVPFGDPVPSHGTEMEGWFWRISDPLDGRVVVALCSANRHPDGDWSTAAIALHPGGSVRSAAIDGVEADRTRNSVTARAGQDLVDAERDRLRMVIGDSESS